MRVEWSLVEEFADQEFSRFDLLLVVVGEEFDRIFYLLQILANSVFDFWLIVV